MVIFPDRRITIVFTVVGFGVQINKRIINVRLVFSPSYLTYIKLCTLVKRNESMAHTLQAKLKEPEADENKRGPKPQDLIRLYDIILQVNLDIMYVVIFLIISCFMYGDTHFVIHNCI